ncbi:MAG: hypothetical protein OEZ51_06945, partial [Nitrospinota bacterium]|nr:hypothetical protein [Nitrospinota bacterium]
EEEPAMPEPEPVAAEEEPAFEPEMEPELEPAMEATEEEPALPEPEPVAAEEEPAFEPEMEPELEPAMEAAEEESAPPEPEPMISEEEPAFEPEMEPELEPAMEAAEEESAPPEPEPMISEEEPAFEPEMEPEFEPVMEAADEEPVLSLEIETSAEMAAPPTDAQETAPVVEIEEELEEPLVPVQAESFEVPDPGPVDQPEEEYRDEELWAELFPDQKQKGQPTAEAQPATVEPEEESFAGGDFWDQVLQKEPAESLQGVASAQSSEDATSAFSESLPDSDRKNLTDEELWAQAFPEDEEIGQHANQASSIKGDEEKESTIAPLVIGADVNFNEELKDSTDFDESAYGDYDEEEDDFEFQPRQRKLGPFTIPHGRRGDLVVGGVLMVFLLIAGSVYFTVQTFAPDELTNMQTAQTDVPEGLTPRKVPLDEMARDLTKPKPDGLPSGDTPEGKSDAILSEPSEILKEAPEEKELLKDLAESQILKDTGKTQTARIDQSDLQAFTGHSVTMSTIMPVAYNPTDIRVLSFSVEIQLSDAQSAKLVRDSLPVYEEIINHTVEDFLQRKFYNDVLYVKEKLQKRLQTAMNQSLKNGRVRKTKFIDFAIQ